MDPKKNKTEERKGLSAEKKAALQAKSARTRLINQARKKEEQRREMESRKPQPPFTEAEREGLKAEIGRNERDADLIRRLHESRRRLTRAVYDYRNPENHHQPLQEIINTGEEDLLMMDATTLGFAMGEGEVLAVDPSLLTREA